MKTIVTRSKFFLVISILLVLTVIVGFVGFIVGGRMAKGDTITQFLLTQDVETGHPLEGKYEEVSVPTSSSIPPDNLIMSEDILSHAVASHKMYKHSPITTSDICEAKEDLDRNIDFSIETTVADTIANSITIGDRVAILVQFDDERDPAVIIPSTYIRNIKSTNGGVIADNSTSPGFLLIRVSESELVDLKNAYKEGTLYAVRYIDQTKPDLQKSYVKGKAPTVSGPVPTANSSNSQE